jgi:hypothetical protein
VAQTVKNIKKTDQTRSTTSDENLWSYFLKEIIQQHHDKKTFQPRSKKNNELPAQKQKEIKCRRVL